jgi:hypothetical protein
MQEAVLLAKLSVAAYVGPGDLVSGATAWYGLRAYSAAVAATGTQKAINIRRASDNATTDILILPNGNLDVVTAAAFLASTTGFLTTLYDQTGNGLNAVQATPSSQPQLILSGMGPLPVMKMAPSVMLCATNPLAAASVFSISAVAIRTANVTGYSGIMGGGSSGAYFTNAVNTAMTYQSAFIATAPATHSVWHATQFIFTGGANSLVAVDGVDGTPANAGSGNMGRGIQVGESNGNAMTCNVAEAGLWSGNFTAAQRTPMQANQKAYWGTP